MAEIGSPGFELLRRAWSWRVELCLAGAITIAKGVVETAAGADVAALGLVAAALAVLAVPPLGQAVVGLLLWSRRRRRWERALRLICPWAFTRLLGVFESPYGEVARVQVAGGGTVAELVQRAETMAALFGVAEVRVTREAKRADLARVVALWRDPLADRAPAWPWTQRQATNLWEPVPLGVNEDGEAVGISLPEHNLLLGGEPGAGKSGVLALLVAATAHDPQASLYLFDGKLVELWAWRDAAQGFAGVEIDEAIALLREIRVTMEERYKALLASGRRKLAPGQSLIVVVVDELAHYLTWPDRKARDAFTETLRDLVSRGRAAGVVVAAATQKPASDVVPTSLRDLFGYRLALRCVTDQASDTILGSGWASEGYSAAAVDPAQRGVGYLLHESGLPARMRAHYLDDEAIADLVARATALRGRASHG